MPATPAVTNSPAAPAPRKRAPKQTIERIMEAARQEFSNAGLSGARVEEIALRAGVTKQLVYHYYSNKTELYIAVLDEALSRSAMEMLAIDFSPLEPVAALRLLFESIFDQYERYPYLAGFRLAENIHQAEHIQARKRSALKIATLLERIDAVLARGKEAGIFRADLNAAMVLCTSLSLLTGCFTNGMSMSLITPVDLTTPEGKVFWRDYTVQFILNAVCSVQATAAH